MAGNFYSLLALVTLVRCQDKVRFGVVTGGGGDTAQELGPAVEVRLGCVCRYGQHSGAGSVSSSRVSRRCG